MIINGKALLLAAPIKNMLDAKYQLHGVSYGLAEAGYDIRIKQTVTFREMRGRMCAYVDDPASNIWRAEEGRFALASAIEEFQMPKGLVGVVHDKSTWARRGLHVQNTVVEPGWNGFLTLELVYHGNLELTIPAGAGIAQVLFHETVMDAQYEGKYQGQADRPVEAIHV